MNIKNKDLTDSGSSLSIWMDEKYMRNLPKLHENASTDVCVVGGGFIGILTAYQLMKQGIKVVVLEDGPLTGGETGRTTAHLTNVLDDRYYKLIELFGKEGAELAANSHRQAIDYLENTVESEKIDCDFERVDAYLFCAVEDKETTLEKEHTACLKVGLNNSYVNKAPFAEFNTGKALHFKNHAQFHPLKFLSAIVDKIIEGGGKIYCNTHAEKISEEKESCLVETSSKFQVHCKAVVVATNVPINDRVFIHTKQAAYRTYVLAGKIPKNSLPKALYYDTADPYHYLRVYTQEGEDYLIVGGQDHRTGEYEHPEECYSELERWTRERIPTLGKILYKWSGQIIEPVDCMAFIGKNPGNEHIFMATGDSGNGLTHGAIAAMLLTDLILGNGNPWEELYKPSRKNINSLGEYINENANTAWQYRDWVVSEEEKAILPGCGKIVGSGTSKEAVYKDEQGCLHRSCAICPHLAGVVRWNEAEKTWDCPCHGSRFDAYGKVINGPANGDLEKRG